MVWTFTIREAILWHFNWIRPIGTLSIETAPHPLKFYLKLRYLPWSHFSCHSLYHNQRTGWSWSTAPKKLVHSPSSTLTYNACPNLVQSVWVTLRTSVTFKNPFQILSTLSHWKSILCTLPHSMAGWWRFPNVLHCHDGKADCSDVLYIFSVRIKVYERNPRVHHSSIVATSLTWQGVEERGS